MISDNTGSGSDPGWGESPESSEISEVSYFYNERKRECFWRITEDDSTFKKKNNFKILKKYRRKHAFIIYFLVQ